MRGNSGGLVFFLFSFLLLLSHIQSSSDATETTVTPELTTTVKSDRCRHLQSSYPIAEVITCTGKYIKINTPPHVLDLSQYQDREADQLLTNTITNPPSMRLLQSSLVIAESQLTLLKLEIYLDDENQEFTVIHNKHLKNITLLGGSSHPVKVTVKGNKEMSEETINQIKTVFNHRTEDSYIQGYGECCRDSPKSFKELEGCHYINGDLHLGQLTDAYPIPSTVTEIRGCVKIMESSLKSIDFLLDFPKIICNEKNEIKNNTNLCISSVLKHKLHRKIRSLEFEDNKICNETCTWEWALKNGRNLDILCHTIEGDVVIAGHESEKELEALYFVEEIHGQLRVYGNTFSNFTMFERLKLVMHVHADKPAIHIHDNPDLEYIKLPSLRQLYTPNSKSPVLVVENNNEDFFEFSQKEYKRLSRLGKIKVPVMEQEVTANNTVGESAEQTTTKTASLLGSVSVLLSILPFNRYV